MKIGDVLETRQLDNSSAKNSDFLAPVFKLGRPFNDRPRAGRFIERVGVRKKPFKERVPLATALAGAAQVSLKSFFPHEQRVQ